MSDQCGNCKYRGHWDKCSKELDCKKEDWIVQWLQSDVDSLTAEVARLKEEIGLLKDEVTWQEAHRNDAEAKLSRYESGVELVCFSSYTGELVPIAGDIEGLRAIKANKRRVKVIVLPQEKDGI